jgi:hypothetical protein
VQAGVNKATEKAVTWLRKALKRQGGSASGLRVSDTPLKSLSGIGKSR